MSDSLRAVDGRVPGRRGRATRERLLDATEGLLATTAYRDVKVVDIAREAGTSPATFYQYFPDVEAAVHVLAEGMAEDGASLADRIAGATWTGAAGYETALGLVDGFLDFWEEHGGTMRVVDLHIAEGDQRFRQIRTAVLQPVTHALRDVIANLASAGRHLDDVDPAAQSASVVSMLAHVASHRPGLAAWGAGPDALRTSLARITYWSVTARKPKG